MTILISGTVGAVIGAVLTIAVMALVQIASDDKENDNHFRYCTDEWESEGIKPVSANMNVYEMQCSACGDYVVLETGDKYKYCPRCGAKMKEETE